MDCGKARKPLFQSTMQIIEGEMVIKLTCIGSVRGSNVFLFKCAGSYWIIMSGCVHGFECSQYAVMLANYRTIRFNQVPDFTSSDEQLATII